MPGFNPYVQQLEFQFAIICYMPSFEEQQKVMSEFRQLLDEFCEENMCKINTEFIMRNQEF